MIFVTFEKNKLYDYLGDFAEYLEDYNCFVAGGAISSLFTNKEINDIDIYFRNESLFIEFVTEMWESYSAHVVTATDKATLITKISSLNQVGNLKLKSAKCYG